MALPIMKATEFGAAPQRTEPISNKRTEHRKVVFTLKVYNFPKASKKAQLVSRYAVPYQPTSLNAWNSSVMVDVTVEMISLSCEHASQQLEQSVA